MRRNYLKSSAAALLTAALVSSPVLAAAFDGTTEAPGATTVSIPKGIVIENSGYTQTYSPNAYYTFTATPATVSGITVTDSDGNSINIQSGVANGLVGDNGTETSVDFTEQNIVETDAGETNLSQELVGYANWDVDLSVFEEPGVYRYVITDVTRTYELYRAGLVRASDYDTTRNLDLYIGVDTDTGELEVLGYALTDDEDGNITPDTDKDPGFVTPGTSGAETVPSTVTPTFNIVGGDATASYGENGVDRYISYNYAITKYITGGMADPEHEFPFAITVAEAEVSKNGTSEYVFVGSDEASLEVSNVGTLSTALADGDTYYIYGANPFMIYSVIETNDTNSIFELTTSDGTHTETLLPVSGTAGVEDVSVSNYLELNTENDVSHEATGVTNVEFTNSCESVDPTGLASRVTVFVEVAASVLAVVAVAVVLKIRKGKQVD